MERQCRVCFDTDELTPFVTPCNCRGTQAYIHAHCLALYIQHFPDGLCRVCRSRMAYGYSDEALYCMGVFVWMLALAHASTLPSDPRGMYLTMIGGIILYYLIVRRRPVLVVVLGMIVSASFLYAPPETMFWILAIVTGLFTGIVLWMYIPTLYLLLGGAILTSAFYSLFLIVFTLTRTDPVLAALLVCFLGTLWYLIIRARPPLRIL